ncbi:MAG: class I SAM-dependent methyltransferase [Acetobacteraceae bacterium]|nr:class I SAM-dependent methyltransferase [Acetobacteraceae bacterium]
MAAGVARHPLRREARAGRLVAAAGHHPPGHAEVDQHALPAVEAHQHVFGAPPEPQHPAARDAGRHALGEGPAQAVAVHRDPHDPLAFHHGREAAHHRLDLGEFGHGPFRRLRVCSAAMSDTTPRPPGKTDRAPTGTTVDFGYRQVPATEKVGMVRQVFDSVAPKYDVMNDLMSLGLHRAWKRIFVNAIGARPQESLLDLAGGTGDISFRALEAGAGRVICSDINGEMLAVAQTRALDKGIVRGLSFLCADAERLPLPDRSVDKVSMAFGLRNCTDKDAVLREVRRVLRPGGRFHCLEFSKLEISALEPLYDAWSFKALPAIGERVAKDSESYRYLAESIRTFPNQETLAAMMRKAGLERVAHRNLAGGIVAIHTGWRL